MRKTLATLTAIIAIFSTFGAYAAMNIISKDDAIQKALKTVNGKVIEVELNSKMFKPVYEVEIFTDDGKFHKIYVNIGNGDVHKGHSGKVNDKNLITYRQAKITSREAEKAALADFPNGIVKDFELKRKSGKAVYEIEVIDGKGLKHEVYVDAEDGEVLFSRQDEDVIATPPISLEESKTAALKAIKGVVLYSMLEEEDHVLVYDVKLISENMKMYNVRIDANTGKVLKTKED